MLSLRLGCTRQSLYPTPYSKLLAASKKLSVARVHVNLELFDSKDSRFSREVAQVPYLDQALTIFRRADLISVVDHRFSRLASQEIKPEGTNPYQALGCAVTFSKAARLLDMSASKNLNSFEWTCRLLTVATWPLEVKNKECPLTSKLPSATDSECELIFIRLRLNPQCALGSQPNTHSPMCNPSNTTPG